VWYTSLSGPRVVAPYGVRLVSRKLLSLLILAAGLIALGGCLACTGSKLVLTIDHTVTPCLPTPNPEMCP